MLTQSLINSRTEAKTFTGTLQDRITTCYTLYEESANTPVFEDSDKEDLFATSLALHNKQSPLRLPGKSVIKETIVQKGFGTIIPQSSHCSRQNGRRKAYSTPILSALIIDPRQVVCSSYPPASNAAYNFAMMRVPKSCGQSFLDGVAGVKKYPSKEDSGDGQGTEEEIEQSSGAIAARNIRWARRTYDEDELIFPFDEPKIALQHEIKQFISIIDNAEASGQEVFAYCERCQKNHIPWGSPLTLQDRDTCHSMLPEWFPAELFQRPWDTFIKLINDLVRVEEIRQGRCKDPFVPPKFDKEYHEPSNAWAVAGRHGGWWKCRSGPNVPYVERACSLCHGQDPRTAKDYEAQRIRMEKNYERILAWFQRNMEDGARKDKTMIKAQLGAIINESP